MPVLERSELEASPLADLHAIADQVGVDGFKRLRKADLIDKILAVQGGGDGADATAGESSSDGGEDAKPARKRRLIRPRRASKRQEPDDAQDEGDGGPEAEEPPVAGEARRGPRRARSRGAGRRGGVR